MKDVKEMMEALLAGKKLKDMDCGDCRYVYIKEGKLQSNLGTCPIIYFEYPESYEIYKEPKPEPNVYKCWVNFYTNGVTELFSSKVDADKAALTININNYTIKRLNNAVEVTVEVGE